jgi:hypothetical protein
MRPPNEICANADEFGNHQDIPKEHRISLMFSDHIRNRGTNKSVIDPSGRIESSRGMGVKLRGADNDIGIPINNSVAILYLHITDKIDNCDSNPA